MYPLISKLTILSEYKLLVGFDNGISKIYDVKKNKKDEKEYAKIFSSLFNNVKVDPGGYGISFSDEIGISEYELWINGEEIEKKRVVADENVEYKMVNKENYD